MSMRGVLRRLWDEEQGQDLTEYALLIVLIALAAITTVISGLQYISKGIKILKERQA